jgi:hypothetical protein
MSVSPFVDVARSAALGRPRELLAALEALGDDGDSIIGTLGRHTLIRLVLNTLTPEDVRAHVTPTLAVHLERWRAREWMPIETLVGHFEQARTALEAEGVPLLLLKGFYFGHRLYGGLDRRPQHDVDVLVPERRFRRALLALGRNGWSLHAYDLHSRTLRRGDCKIDVHRCLRRAPAFRVDEDAPWRTAIDVDLGPLRVRTLSDEWTLVFLLLAAFEDVGQGTAKLKQMADLWLLLRSMDDGFDWEAFFAGREREALLEVVVNVLVLTTSLFDAGLECPGLGAALARRAHLADAGSRGGAPGLVLAERKHEANLAWFARVYPGSLGLYLARFWYGGFPGNLTQITRGRLTSSLRLAMGLPGRAGQPARG